MAFGPFLLLALMEGLVMAAVLSLAAVGLSLVFGVMRVVNVAHGEFFMLGAVIAWFVAGFVPGPAWVAFLAALVIAPVLVGALAAAVDGLVLKRLNYDPEATIVATIGVMYMIQQAALTFYGPDARPVVAPFTWRLQFPWFGYSGYKLFMVLAAVLVLDSGLADHDPHQGGPGDAGDAGGPRCRARLRDQCRPGLYGHVRAWRRSGRHGGGALCADQPCPLPDGA
ncbi:hypothetical protein MASR1M32_28260 [Rhodobacter sp.]